METKRNSVAHLGTANQIDKPALPTIKRSPGWCLMLLADALQGLANMSQPESEDADEQLNLLRRSELAALFELLHDYADAARRALPPEIGDSA